jgi:hypothetical protein
MKPLATLGLAALLYSSSAVAQSPEVDGVRDSDDVSTYLDSQPILDGTKKDDWMLYKYNLTPTPTYKATPLSLPNIVKENHWIYATGYNLALLGIITGVSAALWPDNFANPDPDYAAANYKIAYTQWPVWNPDAKLCEYDGDSAGINCGGHLLMGAEMFRRYRRCGSNEWQALLGTITMTVVHEFGIEARGAPPSTFDLWYTPFVGGMIAGEGLFQLHQLASEIENETWRIIMQSVTDPFGELGMLIGTPC